jgi:hypothetical protein
LTPEKLDRLTVEKSAALDVHVQVEEEGLLPLRMRRRALAEAPRRFGYRRLTVLLQRKGGP